MGTDWKPEVQEGNICVSRKDNSQTQRRLLAKGVLNSELRKRTSKSTQSINNLNNIGIKNKGRRKWKHIFFIFHFTFIYFFLCVCSVSRCISEECACTCMYTGRHWVILSFYDPLPCGFETESLAESEAYLDDQLDQSKERF